MACRQVLAVSALVAAGCGGVSSVGESPSWRQPPAEIRSSSGSTATAAPRRGPQTIELAPEGEGARAYNPAAAIAPGDSPRAEAVANAVARAAARAEIEPPGRDGRLDAVCRDLAAVAPADAPVPYRLIEFALQRHGIIEPSPHLVVVWGPEDDVAGLAEKLEARLPGILGSAPFDRLGVGAARRGPGEVATVIALQPSYLETGPIPRVLPEGGSIQIEGTVEEPFDHPEVFVTHSGGVVTRTPLRRVDASSFRADVSCGGRRGRQQIEITARDMSGSTVLANFPVWCYEAPPASAEVTIGHDEADLASPEAAEARIVELVNRDREAHDLPPLEPDPRVADVARQHSQEMFETGVVAHVSPTTGTAADRVRAAGIRTPVVLENVARAYGVIEAHEGLMNSPGHRANVLAEKATHVGIGVVFGERVAGRRELFITQLFTRVSPPIDPGAAADRVRGALGRAADVEESPVLTEVAQAYADEVAGGTSPEEAAALATRRLRARRAPFRGLSTFVTTVADVSGVDVSEALRGRDVTHVGIGVAQGSHDVIGEGAITIVLLLGRM